MANNRGRRAPVPGYLATAGRYLAVRQSGTVLAGWNPDETYWFNDVLRPGIGPSEWESNESQPPTWVHTAKL